MIIPRKGDEWEFKVPGKRKQRKIIHCIAVERWEDTHGQRHQRVVVWWDHLPKGRYSGLRVKTLLQYGRRIRTEAERDAASAALQALWRAKRQEQLKAHTASGTPSETHTPPS